MMNFEASVENRKDWNAVLDVCRKTREAGGRTHLVGGCVRDALGGFPVKEFDLEVFGVPDERLRKLLTENHRVDLYGKSYAVYKIKGSNVDIGIPRRETKTGEGHLGFEVVSDHAMPLDEAASRRDFTINSIYYDPLDDVLSDPFGGAEDWRRKVLRHNSEKFKEDPLRPLRAMQFIARFDLRPDPSTLAICGEIGWEGLPKERVFEEWKKLLLKGRQIGKGLRFLFDCGWLKHFPELEAMVSCPQEPRWHPEGSVWQHTGLCLDAFAKARTDREWEDLVVGFAVLLHDVGKCATTVVKGGRIKSPKHDRIGVSLAETFILRLTDNKKIPKEVLPLVQWHMSPFQLWGQGSSSIAVKRLAVKVGRLDRLIRVCNADHNGRGEPYVPESEASLWLREKAEESAVIDEAPKPLVMGRHLMERGLKPGTVFKSILDAAYEAQINEEFSTLEDGLAHLETLPRFRSLFRSEEIAADS